jgi:CheY-like chemotaxis protein
VKKLIIIEDDTDAREMAVFTFENNGYEVVKAGKDISIQEVIALKPHIIVVGYQLSGGTPGSEVCLKLKADKATKDIPVILYSPNLDMDKISQSACADGYVAKPLELEDFMYLVHRIALS